MKDEVGEKIMTEKNCAFKRKPKFENTIFHLEKNTIDVEDHR